MKCSTGFTLLIFLSLAAGCSTPGHRDVSAVSEPIQLTATMPSQYDVTLSWQDRSAVCAGHIVEFATEPEGEYTVLGFWPSNCTTFLHPRLVPDTTFYYRVRPYVGPASATVEISLPADLSDNEYAKRYATAEDYSWGAPVTIPARAPVALKSIRNTATAADAGPTDLKAVIAPETVSGIHLTWTDHDTDAEGYLIEMKMEKDPDYRVCAVVGPKINSFGWSFAPPERKGSFRVRAYYFGDSSNLVAKKTGPESEATYLMSRGKE